MELRRSLFHWSRAHLTPKNSIWAAGLMRFASLNLCWLLTCLPSLFRSLSKMMIAETQVKAFCVLSSDVLSAHFLSSSSLVLYLFSSHVLSSPPPTSRLNPIASLSALLYSFFFNRESSVYNDKSVFNIVSQSFLWCLDSFQPPVVHFSYWWSNQASQFVWVIIFSFIS